MVENLIAGYLASGKRLVIPDLGAFLRKETGEIVFVEFLKKDDGVLAELIARSQGITSLEAAAAALQFSGEIKSDLSSKGFYIVPKVGTLRRDTTGTINLTANPDIQKSAGEYQPEAITSPVDVPPVKPEPKADPVPAAGTAKASPATQPPVVKPAPAPQPKTVTRPAVQEFSTRPLQNPIEQAAPRPTARHRPPVNVPQKKKKADMIMVIAIIAAIIAIGSMVFGLMVNNNPIDNLRPTQERVIDTGAIEDPSSAEE